MADMSGPLNVCTRFLANRTRPQRAWNRGPVGIWRGLPHRATTADRLGVSFYTTAMPITKCAPTARWGWSYSEGRYLGVEVEGTTAAGKPCKGTLKALDLAQLKQRLVSRGYPRTEAIRLTIEPRR